MKVALNATSLLSPLTGIGHYTYQLAKGLQALPELELDLFYGYGWGKQVRDLPVPRIAAIKSMIKRYMSNAYSVNDDLNMMQTSDRDIWAWAKQTKSIIISKDEDFVT